SVDPNRSRVLGASGRSGGAAVAALHSRFRPGGEEDLRIHRRARHPPAVPGRRRARRAETIPPPQRAVYRRADDDGCGAAARPVRIPDAVRQRGRLRDGSAVPRDQCGRPHAAMRMHLKMAGGGDMKQMSLDEFLVQAKDYEESGGALDRIFQILNTLDRTHPFSTLRAAELQRWIEAGHYQRILDGEYTRR